MTLTADAGADGGEELDEEPSRFAATELVALLVGALVMLAALGFLAAQVVDARRPPPATTYRYVVPAGTAAELAAGEALDLMPATLDVRVGDSLVIENRDTKAQQVGPYLVGAGQTLRQRFEDPGTIRGTCTVNSAGTVTIVVTPR